MNSASKIVLNYVLPLAVLVAAIGTFFVLGKRPETQRRKRPPQTTTPVEVVALVPHTGGQFIEATGVAVPFREIAVAAEVGGRVTYKSPQLQAGRIVKAGEKILQIDPRDYQIEVDRLKQLILQTEAQLEATDVSTENTSRLIRIAEESLEVSQKEKKRVEDLSARNAASTSEIDAVRRSEILARQQVTILHNQLRSLASERKQLQIGMKLNQIELQRAELDLQRATISAPITGIVTIVNVEENATVVPGTSLTTVEDTSKIEVFCQLESKDVEALCLDTDAPDVNASNVNASNVNASNVNVPIDLEHDSIAKAYRLPQLPVEVSYQRAGRTYRWQGTLSRQDGRGIDQRTRTLPCRIEIRDPRNAMMSHGEKESSKSIALTRGMFVRVRIECPTRRATLAVPEYAIRPGNRLWLVRDGKLEMKPVLVTGISDDMALIEAEGNGISIRDQAIVSPVPHARDGMPVVTGMPGKGGRKRAGGKRGGGPGKGAGADGNSQDSGPGERRPNSGPRSSGRGEQK